MPGPNAKHPSVRARRNTTSTRAKLTKKATSTRKTSSPTVPKLPSTIDWYSDVEAWWADLWGSEPRDEWIDADLHLLFVAARLYQMMLDPETKVTAAKACAGEFRQIMTQFGLTPMARRTLQWEIEKPEDTGKNTPAKKAPAKRAAKKADPRAKFRVVNGGAAS